MARALARTRREPARRFGNPLSGDRDLDRRHGAGQVPDERYRELGAVSRQISRDAQLLDVARLAGAAGEHSLSRKRWEGAFRAHAEQYGAGEPAHPRAAPREPSDDGWPRAAA